MNEIEKMILEKLNEIQGILDKLIEKVEAVENHSSAIFVAYSTFVGEVNRLKQELKSKKKTSK